MNKYEILGVVGEGAYGVVLKCRNRETNEIRKKKHNSKAVVLCAFPLLATWSSLAFPFSGTEC